MNMLAKVAPRGDPLPDFQIAYSRRLKRGKRVEYSVLKELGEKFSSEALDRLVCTE